MFPVAGYAELYQALQATVAAGGPAFHLASYPVQSNPYQAIHGGWQVRVRDSQADSKIIGMRYTCQFEV